MWEGKSERKINHVTSTKHNITACIFLPKDSSDELPMKLATLQLCHQRRIKSSLAVQTLVLVANLSYSLQTYTANV